MEKMSKIASVQGEKSIYCSLSGKVIYEVKRVETEGNWCRSLADDSSRHRNKSSEVIHTQQTSTNPFVPSARE